MRVHRLEVTAFGPFSGEERVDFDELTDAGLFLLCGPTGAGKTSVLDAICFALYGEVPGDRNSAKRLRSDHAAPGIGPSVLLEVSINARRFRIRRSPAWQRPKRRGTGATTEQARVSLEEQVDGAWTHLSNRLDETGHLVTGLLGMNLTQFTQVAMLPQGRFQSFLRARSDERHKVLQQLFRTHRFEDIEKWLVAHRQSLKTAGRAHQDAVASVVSRLSEASCADLPADWDLHDLAVPAEEGGLAGWAAGLLAEATSERDALAGELRVVTARVTASRADLQRARETLDLRRRHAEALRVRDSLAETEPDAQAARDRLDAARRAAAVAPLLRVAEAAEHTAGAAQHDLGEVLADAARLLEAEPPDLTAHDLALAEREAHEAVSIAKILLPRESELTHAQRRLAEAEAAVGELTTQAAALDERIAEIPPELAASRQECVELSALAGTLQAVTQREQQLVVRSEAAQRVVSLGSELEAARAQLRVRVDAAQSLREAMHDIREARINGMAAELAAALASGDSCPVCGSADHPAMATPVAGAPTQIDEEAARTAYEDADFVRQTQAEAVATLERNRALAEQSAGGKTLEALRSEVEEARERLAACRSAGARLESLSDEVAALEAEQERLRRCAQQVQAELARLRQECAHSRTTIAKVSAELSALFAEQEVVDSVERLIEAKSSAGAAFARARAALTERDRAVARAIEAREQAALCAVEHGFDTPEAAADADLDAAQVTVDEELLRTRGALRARAEAVLSDPEAGAAAAAAPADLVALERLAAVAEESLAEVGARSRVAQTRVTRVARLQAELTAELEAWAPTRSAYAVAQALSTLVEGKGGDNTLQMRLSAYVLASRLRQVVAAANERLRTMSDQRYTLEHSATKGVGELRGGLSLQVRDEWTGESRDPATLSGGETFIASLALALGLADVVTQEAGGSSIDTLFIDEGFGTLDPETLDDVMDTLDGLRDGGRVVGIVSHVPEMRTRVTAQLQIRKDRSGSHVVAVREPA